MLILLLLISHILSLHLYCVGKRLFLYIHAICIWLVTKHLMIPPCGENPDICKI